MRMYLFFGLGERETQENTINQRTKPHLSACSQFEIGAILEEARLRGHIHGRGRQRVRIDGHLHAALPFLLPLIGYRPVVIRGQRLRVRQLHGTYQILPAMAQSRRRNGKTIEIWSNSRTTAI